RHQPQGPLQPRPLHQPQAVQGPRGRRGGRALRRLLTDRWHASCIPSSAVPATSSVSHAIMSNAQKTVLLVEDNEDNLVVYRTILEHVGYRVVEARDGEEGVMRAREQKPDLILMDISIPKIDGWEATQRLK